jgi:hypothetical protein
MWLAFVGALSAAGVISLVQARRRALAQAPSESAAELLVHVLRTPTSIRVAEMLRRARADSWEWKLADSIASAVTAFERVDAISVRVADLDRSLDVTRRWLPVCAHASLLVAVLLAVVGALTERLPEGLAGGGLSALAALAALGAERRFGEVEAAKRILVDRLVAALQDAAATDSGPPE